MSVRAFAAAAGMSASTVSRFETGESDPRVGQLAALAAVAGCAVAVLRADGQQVQPHEFDGACDRGNRALPAHSTIWPVTDLEDWWARTHYSTWLDPPLPTHTYSFDPRVREEVRQRAERRRVRRRLMAERRAQAVAVARAQAEVQAKAVAVARAQAERRKQDRRRARRHRSREGRSAKSVLRASRAGEGGATLRCRSPVGVLSEVMSRPDVGSG